MIETLRARFGEKILSSSDFRGDESVTISPATLLEMATFLRDEAGLGVLSDMAGVDGLHLGWSPRFEVVYIFFGYADRDAKHMRVKVRVPEDNLHVPSLAATHKSANWLERECWDQFGIVFDGHPNLIRILNHEEFVGHPLRKDYPVDGRHVLRRATDLD